MRLLNEKVNCQQVYKDRSIFAKPLDNYLNLITNILNDINRQSKGFYHIFQILEIEANSCMFDDNDLEVLETKLSVLNKTNYEQINQILDIATKGNEYNIFSNQTWPNADENYLRSKTRNKNWRKYNRISILEKISKLIDTISSETKTFNQPALHATEKIYRDINIDIDDQILSSKNKYYMFFSGKEIESCPDINFNRLQLKSKFQVGESETYSIDKWGNFWKINDNNATLISHKGNDTKIPFIYEDPTMNEIKKSGTDASGKHFIFSDMKRKSVMINTRYKKPIIKANKFRRISGNMNICCFPIVYSSCSNYFFYYEKTARRIYAYSFLVRKNIASYPCTGNLFCELYSFGSVFGL